MLKPHRHNKENNVLETDIYNTKINAYKIKVFAVIWEHGEDSIAEA